ncbi:hypothetical protein [Nitrosomonas cryotolerans]|uniref:hypothetical protein n=1 Tax=Nitrosomonas cryotolerans TaxID=44575 RepID=UPI00116048CA|nr:hypothetical protein [Nitrosomonas cryotolerans]
MNWEFPLFVEGSSQVKVGGHASWPLFEEVPLVRGIRQLGYFQSLREAMLVDSRCWRQDGWWCRT